jgi:hypothetical protein
MRIQIRHTGGRVDYPNAQSCGLGEDAVLHVKVGGDTIYFSPNYWQQYTVDPQQDDLLDLQG